MNVNPSIFREYDIRGIVGDHFDERVVKEYEKWYGTFPGLTIDFATAEAIGKAYGSRIRERGGKKVLVGHELRPFGEQLKMHFVKGVRSTGCDVYDAGVSLTPIIYFGIAYYGYDGGVNITGSHNVYFYNGFKTMAKDVYPIYGEELQKMRMMIEADMYTTDSSGSYHLTTIVKDYEKYLLDHIQLKKKLKIVIDCGNGSAGIFAPNILRRLGCEVVELYTKPDATFPNHVPDPADEYYMTDLSAKVLEVKADMGIGIDADGDRMGLVDERGKFEYADRILSVFVNHLIETSDQTKVLYDVKCANVVKKTIEGKGAIPLMHRTGHAPIKETIRNDNSIAFAGELSGHFYFIHDYFKIDDGIYAAAQFMSLLEKDVSSYFAELPASVVTPELKLPCSDEKKKAVVSAVSAHFEKNYEVIKLDGARIVFSKDSWALVRASNTTPYISLRFEANSEKEVLEMKTLVDNELKAFPEVVDRLDLENVTSHTGRLGWI